MSFSAADRQRWLQSLAGNPPDVLVIGGGVVGCSIACHAAQLGLNVVLAEREDLGSGASGNSTGLAHAGLRYLTQGRLLYVFHESRERERLERMAPHWVRPFNFMLPVYADDPYPFWMVRLGTALYDWMGRLERVRGRRPAKRLSRTVRPDEIRDRFPGIKLEGLKGGIEYFVDAQLQDSRFTLGWAQKAAAHGARILTYTEVSGIDVTNETAQKVHIKDRLGPHEADCIVPLVINATGAWIDEVRAAAGCKTSMVSPSKGIHLVVDHVANTPLIFSSEVKGRVFFVIPAGNDRSLIGTTDTPLRSKVDWAGIEPQDIQELLRRLFHYFPYFKQGGNLLEAIELYKQVHIRGLSWGVRPLLRQEGETAKASREHRLIKDGLTFWSMPGVKLTAARAAGLEAAKAAWKRLRKDRPLTIAETPLPGGEMKDFDRFLQDAKKRFKLGDVSDDLIPYLVSTYGTRYIDILHRVDLEPHYREPVLQNEPWIPAEAAFAADEEMVLTLNDFLWRRTKWALLREIPEPALHRIISAMAESLGWGPEEVERQLALYHTERQRHRWHPA